jgi:hypothetical protein
VFKIIKTDLSSPFLPGSMGFDETDNELLTQYCVTERWTGDLSNGLFTLGDKATQAHGLPQRACGLSEPHSLLRAARPHARARTLRAGGLLLVVLLLFDDDSSRRRAAPAGVLRRRIDGSRGESTQAPSSASSSSPASRSTSPAAASSGNRIQVASSGSRPPQAASLASALVRMFSTGIGRPRK